MRHAVTFYATQNIRYSVADRLQQRNTTSVVHIDNEAVHKMYEVELNAESSTQLYAVVWSYIVEQCR